MLVEDVFALAGDSLCMTVLLGLHARVACFRMRVGIIQRSVVGMLVSSLSIDGTSLLALGFVTMCLRHFLMGLAPS